jgi:hypothetical protein
VLSIADIPGFVENEIVTAVQEGVERWLGRVVLWRFVVLAAVVAVQLLRLWVGSAPQFLEKQPIEIVPGIIERQSADRVLVLMERSSVEGLLRFER